MAAPKPRMTGVALHPWQPGPGHGPVLSYVTAAALRKPLVVHPLLGLTTWDPKPWPKYLVWNVLEHPAYAVIWVSLRSFGVRVGERGKEREREWQRKVDAGAGVDGGL